MIIKITNEDFIIFKRFKIDFILIILINYFKYWVEIIKIDSVVIEK